MLLDKPPWVSHDKSGRDLFSVDVSPDAARFATGGADNKVKIWALPAVLRAEAEAASSAPGGTPLLLATLPEHCGPVNALRFSRSGRRLASGSDDKLVLVHELRAGAPRPVFGSADPPAVENWACVLQLRGHANNVTDVAWSPDDALLATCSLDNYVFVWDATGVRVATLAGHESFVKGVAWDPIGTYLASQSDDKSVVLWRCEDWAVAARIRDPFERSQGSTYSLRLGWSPDGRALTAVNSSQHGIHTAVVLDRGSWARSFNFVGHKAPVVAVRFNQRLFRRASGGDLVFAVAVAAQDCQVTVWLSAQPKPVVVIKQAFTNTVVDMSWSPDGYSLLCASLDGTIACLTFSADELGAAASEHEVEAALQRTYGAAARRGRGAPGGGLLEDPSLLSYAARGADAAAAARAAAAQQAALAAAAAARAGGPGALAPLPAGSPQREFRGADGRRRIVPVALADGAPAGPLPPMPPPLLAPPPPSLGRSPLGLAPPTTSQQAPATAPAQQAGPPHAQQALGFPSPAGGAPGGGDGTPRRVAPVPVVPAPAPAPAPAPQMALALSRPTGGGAPSVKRKAPEPQTAPPPRAITTTAAAPSPAPQPAAPPPGLPLPPLQSALSAQLVPADAASGTAATVLEARNGGGALGAAALSCTRGGAVLWSDRLGAPVVALAGNAQFAAAATADGSLQVYTPAGRRALPALALGAPAVHLAAQGLRLAAVAASGTLWVWQLSPGLAGGADGQGGSCVLRASVLPALTPSAGLAALRMAACGAPLAVRTDGAALLYSTALQAWARVADASFLRSDFASAAPATAAGDGELAALGAAAARGALRGAGASAAAAMLLGAPGGGGGPGAAAEARALTGRHLEALLAGAGALRSAPELRRYLPLYAAHLARATADAPQPDARLRELLTELLGPLRWREVADQPDALGPGGWAPRLLGVRKRQLLTEDVLPAVAAARGAQRLAAEFAELAAELEEPGPAEE